jgi:hypothetical protein
MRKKKKERKKEERKKKERKRERERKKEKEKILKFSCSTWPRDIVLASEKSNKWGFQEKQ